MEPKRSNRRHLQLEELLAVLNRMDSQSVAVTFQYRRWARHFRGSMAGRLAVDVGREVAYIVGGQAPTYVVAKSAEELPGIRRALERVGSRPTAEGVTKTRN